VRFVFGVGHIVVDAVLDVVDVLHSRGFVDVTCKEERVVDIFEEIVAESLQVSEGERFELFVLVSGANVGMLHDEWQVEMDGLSVEVFFEAVPKLHLQVALDAVEPLLFGGGSGALYLQETDWFLVMRVKGVQGVVKEAFELLAPAVSYEVQ
jgi:hypothetical protein